MSDERPGARRDPKNILLFGGGGHARVVIDIVRISDCSQRIVACVDPGLAPREDGFEGVPLYGENTDLAQLCERHAVDAYLVALGDNWRRRKVVREIEREAPTIEPAKAVHPDACVSETAYVEGGSVVMAGAVINPGVTIGEHCIINSASSVDHDCTLESFSSVAPGATLGGSVTVGELSAICLGADVVNDTRIGSGSIIGAGAVVLDDIPADVVAHGVPAEIVRKRKENESYL